MLGQGGNRSDTRGICSDTPGTERGRELERRESMLLLYVIANARVRLRGWGSELFGYGHAIYPGVRTKLLKSK